MIELEFDDSCELAAELLEAPPADATRRLCELACQLGAREARFERLIGGSAETAAPMQAAVHGEVRAEMGEAGRENASRANAAVDTKGEEGWRVVWSGPTARLRIVGELPTRADRRLSVLARIVARGHALHAEALARGAQGLTSVPGPEGLVEQAASADRGVPTAPVGPTASAERLPFAGSDEAIELERRLRMLAHDIKTPMTAMKGYLDMLLRGMGGPLPERGERYLQKIKPLLERQRDLIDTRMRARELIDAAPSEGRGPDAVPPNGR